MSAITVPTGWVSGCDNNVFVWEGIDYGAGTTVSNNAGKARFVMPVFTSNTGLNGCAYIFVRNASSPYYGAHRITFGTPGVNNYTFDTDTNYISAGSGLTISLLWNISIRIRTGYPSITTLRGEFAPAFDYATGKASFNLKSISQFLFSLYPGIDPYNGGPTLPSGANDYELDLFTHCTIEVVPYGRFADWVGVTGEGIAVLTGYVYTNEEFYIANSGLSTNELQAFTLGERPLNDASPAYDCNSYNIATYIVGDVIRSIYDGVLPAGVDFDTVESNLIVY